MEYVIVLLVSYLIGSIPNGLIFGKLIWKTDLRECGSKNIGATNAYRVLGPWPAALVFLCDASKGILGVYLGQALLSTPLALLAGGMAAIIGHNWSLFLKFKGGRGVATGLGVIASLSPQATLIIFLVWLGIVFATRYVSLASITAAALAPVSMWLLGERTEYVYFGVLAALFVIIRHKSNIERLLKGEESKIKAGGPPQTDEQRKK